MLIGCGDSYVALISKHKAELEKNIIAPYIDFDLMNSLQQKETFYKLCEKHGVDYPGTIIYDQSMGLDFEMNFPYPVILSRLTVFLTGSIRLQPRIRSTRSRTEKNWKK